MSDLFRFGDPAERALGTDGVAVRTVENTRGEFGVDKAGCDGADKDTVWSEPLCELLAHGIEACLACAVGGSFGFAAKCAAG